MEEGKDFKTIGELVEYIESQNKIPLPNFDHLKDEERKSRFRKIWGYITCKNEPYYWQLGWSFIYFTVILESIIYLYLMFRGKYFSWWVFLFNLVYLFGGVALTVSTFKNYLYSKQNR